jgi:hypothetical protein
VGPRSPSLRHGLLLQRVHWIDPGCRFSKAAALLEPWGHLAVIATPWVVPPHAHRFWWDVQDDYEAVGAGRVDPAIAHPDRVGELAPLVIESGYFEEPVTRRFPFTVTFSADTYAQNLATQSGTKELPPAARVELVARVRRRIEQLGGTIDAHLLAVLTVARVRNGAPRRPSVSSRRP